jgi:hypothetical protein
MRDWLDRTPWGLIILACLTLGLAPFAPPHLWEKLTLLVRGQLSRPIDWLDLLFHGAPWVLLILKLVVGRRRES